MCHMRTGIIMESTRGSVEHVIVMTEMALTDRETAVRVLHT